MAHVGIAGSCKIGDYVTIAAQCGLAGHLEIGEGVILAARSGITKSLIKPGVYWGTPAQPLSDEKRTIIASRRAAKKWNEFKELRKELEELKENSSSTTEESL